MREFKIHNVNMLDLTAASTRYASECVFLIFFFLIRGGRGVSGGTAHQHSHYPSPAP